MATRPFLIAAFATRALSAGPDIILARQAFDKAIEQMRIHPAAKGEILTKEQITTPLDELAAIFEKMHRTIPEVQQYPDKDILNQIQRVKADPYEVEPLFRVVLILGNMDAILAAKRDFDTANKLSDISKKLKHHLLDVAQTKDAFLDKATLITTRSN